MPGRSRRRELHGAGHRPAGGAVAAGRGPARAPGRLPVGRSPQSSQGGCRGFDRVLSLGGSREFADEGACRSFIAGIVGRHNARRATRIGTERTALEPPAEHAHHRSRGDRRRRRLLERVFHAVPLLLIGHLPGMRIHDDRPEPCPGTVRQPALPGKRKGPPAKAVHVVDHRHVIHSPKTGPMALTGLACSGGLFRRQAFRRCIEAAPAADPAPAGGKEGCRRWTASRSGLHRRPGRCPTSASCGRHSRAMAGFPARQLRHEPHR